MLEIQFTANTFIAPEKSRFRFRLDGYDRDWHEAGPRRVAYYTNVPPGRYTFHVRAPRDWVVVGDLAKIETPVRALNFGEVTVIDADGNAIDAAAVEVQVDYLGQDGRERENAAGTVRYHRDAPTEERDSITALTAVRTLQPMTAIAIHTGARL